MISIVVVYYDQLQETKGVITLLNEMSHDVEWIVVDNGSTDKVEDFFMKTLKPKRFEYIRNEKNEGVIKAYNQAFKAANTDIVAYLHNDFYIYENGWEMRMQKLFEKINNLGIIGTHGSQGVYNDGYLLNSWSNMLEAEIHGSRLKEEFLPVAVLDGQTLICSKEMLKKTGGFDERYGYFHFYDKDISLESLAAGYKNIVVNMFCHHDIGKTSRNEKYKSFINKKTNQNDGDKWLYDHNSQLFNEKWGPKGYDVLPLYIQSDGEFLGKDRDVVMNDKVLQFECGKIKGDKIINCKGDNYGR